jgi:hypothetical protein
MILNNDSISFFLDDFLDDFSVNSLDMGSSDWVVVGVNSDSDYIIK